MGGVSSESAGGPADRLEALIRGRVGLRARIDALAGQELARLARARGLGLAEWVDRLEGGGLEAAADWDAVVNLMTVQESSFFRDRGQMDLLRQRILPEILRRTSPSAIRLWSAGCATGEEAYTLAILLAEASGGESLGQPEVILGTDVNGVALEKARRALYTAWSFRSVDQSITDRWFEPGQLPGSLQPLPGVRHGVRFQQVNLMDPQAPDQVGRATRDLVLCRNVLVHLEEEAVPTVVANLVACLRPGGCLVSAHGELRGRVPSRLAVEVHAQSVVYRLLEAPPGAPLPRPAARPILSARPPTLEAHPPTLQAHPPTLQARPAALLQGLSPPGDLLDQARECGDLGDYTRAQALCSKALEQDPTHLPAHFLAAQLAESRGDRNEAFAHLRRILYLEPDSAGACLEMAALHDAQSEPEDAERLRGSARQLLRQMPADRLVSPYDMSAREILGEIQG